MLLHNLLQSTVHPSVLELQKHLPRREKAQTMEWLRKRKAMWHFKCCPCVDNAALSNRFTIPVTLTGI